MIKIYNEDRKVEKNGTQKYVLEEAEYKKGKIVNSNVLHYSNNELKHFHHKENYSVRKGTFDKGVFHGEYNPNRRYNTKKAELEFCKKIQTICQDCLNPAQEFMASGQIESSKLSQVRKKIVGNLNKAAEKTGLKKPAEVAQVTAKSSGPRDY